MTGSMTGNALLTLTIRLSSSVRFDIGSCGSITPTSTIHHVKELISQREESGMCDIGRQRLIFKGRILSENSRTLSDYGIGTGDNTDGIVLYLVKGSAGGGSASTGNAGVATTSTATPNNSTSSTPAQPNPNANMASNPFLNFGGANPNANNPMANMMNSMGGGGMPDMATFQQQLQQNPEMMADMMNNPMVQSIMNNPEFMRSMFENNPQMRQVLESNPELRHALEDPELMRRSMEMARDPSAMQNMMRNQDLAMANIENMPGGFNALRSMYEDVQAPMMDAMASGRADSGTASNNSGGGGGDGTAGATNQAMPNPWGAPAPSPANNASANNTGGAAANPFASMMGGMGGAIPGTTGAAANNPWANPAMGPNAGNLEAAVQMMDNPMMQQMMDQFMSNPDNMRTMMESNPMLQQMRQTNPQMAAMMENPEVMRSMMNPQNLRSMMQMQQSMQQPSGSLPPGMMPPIGGSGTAVPPPPAGGLDFSSLLGGSGSRGANAAAPMANPFMFPFMPPAAGQQPNADGGGTSTTGNEVPGARFRQQLQNLHDMGFTDRSSNIRALTSSHGNVNRAIEILLESPPEMGGGDSSADAAAEATGDAAGATSSSSDDAAGGTASDPKEATEKKND